jgi:hypothetical protein
MVASAALCQESTALERRGGTMERWRSAARVLANAMVCGVCALVAMGGGVPATAAAATLPDGRAYELVSSPDKNGADILVDSMRTRAASDGSAIAFPSLGVFGDAVGTGVATDYLSVRGSDPDPGTNGWATHAITPPQNPLSFNGVLTADPLYVGDFSPDLDRGVFRAWSPVTDVPDVAETANLYVRTDLRSAGTGAYQLVTTCPLCAGTSPLPPISDPSQTPWYAGASSDFTHVAFESKVNLTTDAPAQFGPRAYEWDAGQLRFVGYIPSDPDTSCGGSGPACVAVSASLPGQGVGTVTSPSRPVNVVSSDGSRVFFTVPTDGSGGVFPFTRTGRIYVRTAGTTTDEITASERRASDSYQVSNYWGAAVDGSRAFFTTGRALTDDAPIDGDTKLYMYDTTKPASDDHNLTLLNVDGEPADSSNGVGQVMVVSDDGRYVYFIASGQLVSGEPLLDVNRGFYMWHDGEIAFIGVMVTPEPPSEIATTDGAYQLSPPQVRTTPDGRYLLLSSHDGSGFSLGYDHGSSCTETTNRGCREFYVYSAETETLACASCDPGRVPPTTDAATGVRPLGSAATAWHLNRALTADGSRVFFTTGEPLVPQDTNGKNDAYQYDVPSGQLHLITSGRDPFNSYFMDASADGSDVFILTRERLVGWDVDASYDMYDARVGGGFPEPPPAVARCSGPACQGAAGPPQPGTPRMGTNVLDGAGDLASVLRPHRAKHVCKRGFVKKRVRGKRRCARRKRHHAQHARSMTVSRAAEEAK